MKYQEEVDKETLFVTVQRRSDVTGLADTRWYGLIVQIEEEGKKRRSCEKRKRKKKIEAFDSWFC